IAAVISASEYGERRGRLLEHARAAGASGFVLFGPDYIRYFTGFWFLSNERPIVYAESAGGESAIFVPEFEVERARAETSFSRIESYPEYPGLEHPLKILGRVVADLGLTGTIAVDQDGYPGILGYQGPPLSEVTGAQVVDVSERIEHMIARKSPAEIELIRESGRWCAHAHRLLQEYTRAGVTEAEASLRAGAETTRAMLEALPGLPQLGSNDGAKAGYRGQIGRRSAWAHAIAHDIVFRRGGVGVQRRARARDGDRAAERQGALPLRARRRRATGRVRHVPPGRHVRRRRPSGHALLRGERPAALLAAAHRPRD